MFRPPAIVSNFDALEKAAEAYSTTGQLSPSSASYDVTSGFFLTIIQRSSDQTQALSSDCVSSSDQPKAPKPPRLPPPSHNNDCTDDDGSSSSSPFHHHRAQAQLTAAAESSLSSTSVAQQYVSTHARKTTQQVLLCDHHSVAVPCAWRMLLVLARATTIHFEEAVLARRASDPLYGAPPSIRVFLRRVIRRKRIADALKTQRVAKPSCDDLKKDALLKMYPDVQLEQLMRTLRLDYIFPNESIIVRGLVERDCYFLHSGEVGVVIGRNTVATIPQGTVLGAQGMVSGEPRTASIIAREACFVWRTTKEAFDRGDGDGGAGGRATQNTQAFSMARELRQRNFWQLHQTRLSSDYLAQFPLFRGISPAGINSIVHVAEAVVLTPGEALDFRGWKTKEGSNLQEGSGDRKAYFILKGRVMVQGPAPASSRPQTPTDPSSMQEEEAFAHFAEVLPGSGRRSLTLSERRVGTPPIACGGGCGVAPARSVSPPQQPREAQNTAPWFEWSAPVWLGAPAMLLLDQEDRTPSPNPPHCCGALKTISIGYCDAIALSLNTLRQHVKPKYVHRMLRNMLAIRKRFMAPLSHEQLLAMLFPGRLSMHFLHRCLFDELAQVPAVYAEGDLLEFGACGDGGRREYAAILLDGFLVDTASGDVVESSAIEPYAQCLGKSKTLWPAMHLLHFGDGCSARAGCRVECIMVRRSDIVNCLIRDLSRTDQETYTQVLSSVYSTHCGRRPQLNCDGLTPADDSPAGERSRYFRKLHDASAKAMAPVHRVCVPPTTAAASSVSSSMTSVLQSSGGVCHSPLTPHCPTSQRSGDAFSGRSPPLAPSDASQRGGSSMSQSLSTGRQSGSASVRSSSRSRQLRASPASGSSGRSAR